MGQQKRRQTEPARKLPPQKNKNQQQRLLHPVVSVLAPKFKVKARKEYFLLYHKKKNTECRSEVSPGMKLQPPSLMQYFLLRLCHAKVFHSYLHCQASCAIARAIVLPSASAHALLVCSYHCSRRDCLPFVFSPHAPRTIHLGAHGW